jgi:hypothetical protein
MYTRLIGSQTRRVYARFNAGDPELAIGRFADKSRLVFRGRSQLGADLRTKSEIAKWLRELMRFELHWTVHDVVVQGPPWNTRLATRYSVSAIQEGVRQPLYEGFQYARLKWGRIYLDEILPDTQALADHLSSVASRIGVGIFDGTDRDAKAQRGGTAPSSQMR